MTLDRLRIAVLTAQRAGIRRTAARVRRLFLLRAVYPRFAAPLYPLRLQKISASLVTAPPLLVREPAAWNGMLSLLHTAPFAVHPPVAWDANPIGHTLWQFRLHEWDWAYPLIHAAQTDPQAVAALVALLQDYFNRVPVGHPLAFEPYPLSRRLVIWGEALRVLSVTHAAPTIIQTLAAELDRGARMLSHNLEHDLDNNHLIANAKALAFVGTLLQQPYGAQGFTLLWEQLRKQIRADGVHIENSTTYHFLVWRDAIEACLLAQSFHIPIPSDILPRLIAMSEFLRAIQYPDNSFPLLNDSVADEFQALDRLENARMQLPHLDSRLQRVTNGFSEPHRFDPHQILFSHSGYAILRAPDVQLVFDAGALGPAFCPGHGHADTLSFELYALNKPRLIDPGTYQYQAGTWRAYFRGTAAHNTLQVDELDSGEVSSSFRVGRMANARLWTEGTWLCGEHDGYTRLSQPITHTRKLKLEPDRTLHLRDEIRGRGEHTYTLYFHLTPDAQPTLANNTALIRFADNVTLHLAITNGTGTLKIIEGWYSPTWYTKTPAPILAYTYSGTPPFEISTTIEICP